MSDPQLNEIELSEEQKGKPGINDWVELRALGEELARQARQRGRDNARR